MAPRTLMHRVVVAALPALLGGCFDEPPIPDSGVPIFADAFTIGFTPNPFDTSDLTSLSIDKAKAHSGTASIRLDVPAAGSGYTGGAVLAANSSPQDLSSTNALVFWATASRVATFDKVGFGLNFNPFPSTYQTTLFGLPLTTEWVRHLVPIPDPARLTAERGMFWYSDVELTGYTAWFDDVKFDTVDPAILALQPAVLTDTATVLVGGTSTVGLELTYADFDGTRRAVDSVDSPGSGPAPAFFSLSSSNPSVASVDATGKITGVLVGQATVTARLAGQAVPGAVTVDVVTTVPTAPLTAAPVPTVAAANVVSMYNSSLTYPNVAVDTWQTGWSVAAPASTYTIPGTGSVVKKYASLQYAGVETLVAPHVNASAMTTMHLDLWTPNASGFAFKLVGFNGNTAGAEARVDFGSGVIKKYRWISLEVPLSSFPGVDLANIGQIVWVNNAPDAETNAAANGTFFIDNVYFHR
jgi:hypothetical protein